MSVPTENSAGASAIRPFTYEAPEEEPEEDPDSKAVIRSFKKHEALIRSHGMGRP